MAFPACNFAWMLHALCACMGSARASARAQAARMAQDFDEVGFWRQVGADAREAGDTAILRMARERIRTLQRLEKDAVIAELRQQLAVETKRAADERDLRRRIADSEESVRRRLSDSQEEVKRLREEHEDEIGRLTQIYEDLLDEERKKNKKSRS